VKDLSLHELRIRSHPRTEGRHLLYHNHSCLTCMHYSYSIRCCQVCKALPTGITHQTWICCSLCTHLPLSVHICLFRMHVCLWACTLKFECRTIWLWVNTIKSECIHLIPGMCYTAIWDVQYGKIPEGANWGRKWASFYMLFGLYAPKFASSKFNIIWMSVCGCKIWSLPIGGRMLNLLWRAGHFLPKFFIPDHPLHQFGIF
jgi:hypothetical protein